MQYIFIKKSSGTHLRKSDSQRGYLKEFPDQVIIEPISALVNPNDFDLVLVEEIQVQQPVKEISKLSLKRKLEILGKWDQFKSFLAANPSIDDEFWLAQSIRTDDPMFTTYAPVIKSQIGLTEEEFNSLLDN